LVECLLDPNFIQKHMELKKSQAGGFHTFWFHILYQSTVTPYGASLGSTPMGRTRVTCVVN
jgi:hypothetical protein